MSDCRRGLVCARVRRRAVAGRARRARNKPSIPASSCSRPNASSATPTRCGATPRQDAARGRPRSTAWSAAAALDHRRDQADGRLSRHRFRAQRQAATSRVSDARPRDRNDRADDRTNSRFQGRPIMRELVVKYLNKEISRRGFVGGLTKAGLTVTAAQGVLASVSSVSARADRPDAHAAAAARAAPAAAATAGQARRRTGEGRSRAPAARPSPSSSSPRA